MIKINRRDVLRMLPFLGLFPLMRASTPPVAPRYSPFPFIDVRDFPSSQAAINAAQPAGDVIFPQTDGRGYPLYEPLYIQPPDGETQTFVSLHMQDKAGFVWRGPDNSSVVVTRGWKCAKAERVNILIQGNGVTAWDITDPSGAGSTSHVTFDTCAVQLLGHNDIAWRGGGLDSIGADVSFLNWINPLVSGSNPNDGHIGWLSMHPNCLNWNWYGGFGWYLDTMIKSEQGGSMFIHGLGSSNNLREFRPGSAGAWSIYGGRFEVGKRFLECGDYTGGNGYPMNVTVSGAEIAYSTPDDGCLISMGTSGSLLLDNVSIPLSSWDERMIRLGGWDGGYGSFAMRGGSIASATDPFFTVGHGNWSVRLEDVGRVDGGYVVGRYANRTPVDGAGA